MITNISTGVDPARVQMGKPSFFVSWKIDGEQMYYFSALRSSVENVKNQLEERQRLDAEEAPKVQDAAQEQFFATDEDAVQESCLMVEGEGAPQYTFLPAQDAQLCLF